eukprot:920328_1
MYSVAVLLYIVSIIGAIHATWAVRHPDEKPNQAFFNNDEMHMRYPKEASILLGDVILIAEMKDNCYEYYHENIGEDSEHHWRHVGCEERNDIQDTLITDSEINDLLREIRFISFSECSK